MRKKLIAIMMMFILMFSITACSNGAKDVGNAVKGTLTVGFDQDFPPMGFVGYDGEFTGFDLDLAAEVAKRLDLKLELQPRQT